MSDKTKHFRFELDRKLNPWLKFEPNFLTWLPNVKIEKTTVYLFLSLFIQFSAIEIRWVLSHAKLMISWLQWLEKNMGCPCLLVSYSHFSTDRAQCQGNHPCFQCARARARSKDAINYAQWGCAMQNRGMTLNPQCTDYSANGSSNELYREK